MKHRLLLFCLLLAASPTLAATYFVRVGGSDANNCTNSTTLACLTIARGLAVATAAGDIVDVGAGTYTGGLTVNTGGSAAGGKITLRGHDGSGCPTGAGGGPLPVAQRPVRPVPTVVVSGGWIINANYFKMDCFEIKALGAVDGIAVSAGRNNVDIINNFIWDGQTSGTVRNCTAGIVAFTYGTLPAAMASDIYVAFNYVNRCEIGIVIGARNFTAEFNELERMCCATSSGDNDYMRVFGEDIVIRGNYLHGIVLADQPTAHIDCFQSWNIGNPGEVGRRVTIDRNTCFNYQEGIIVRDVSLGEPGTPSGSHTDWTVTNNVFAHDVIGGIGGGWCMLFDSVSNVVSYHNTCYDTSVVGYQAGTNGTHKNNIHFNTSTNPYFAATGGSVTGDKNLLYQVSQTIAGFPNDIKNLDPLFVSVATNDVHLLTGSPAIAAGATGTGVVVDRDAVARGSPPDIGAFEFIASGSPATGYDPASLTFASTPVGHGTVTQTITLTEVGNAALAVSSVAASGTNAADFHVTSTCGAVSALGTCTITIYFNPGAAGSRSGSVTVTSDAASSPDVLTLSGTAVTKSSIALVGVPQ